MLVDIASGPARRSPTPELNPFDAFIGDGERETESDKDDRRASATQKTKDERASLVPTQLPSIVDEFAVVRYYRDGSIMPIIFSDGQQGTAAAQGADAVDGSAATTTTGHYDVALALDMRTGCGGKIWPAAEVLGAYIAARRAEDQWHHKTIVELGAGTGLVGLLAAQLGDVGGVWITDQKPMLQLMQRNLDLNPAVRKRCFVGELNWGEEIASDSGIPRRPDVLLLADCVYLEVAFQPLVDTLCALCTRETEVLFCYQQRRKADKRFFKLLRKHFTFADVDDDDAERQRQYTRQGTHLYRIVKR